MTDQTWTGTALTGPSLPGSHTITVGRATAVELLGLVRRLAHDTPPLRLDRGPDDPPLAAAIRA